MRKNFLALIAAAALLTGMSACSKSDNPAEPTSSQADILAQLKQGVWTEYDNILVDANSAEELAEMPSIGMMIEGDKAYFFTYTAKETSTPIEGKVTYDKATRKGTITFPIIKDNPLSGQTVSFTATTDETLEFELTYEGVKTTATCTWHCKNMDNWNVEINDENWRALIANYKQYAADAGPDASIDWSDSKVKDLDKPLVWDAPTASKARTRDAGAAAAIIEGISAGLEIFASLFEPDHTEEINKKLDNLSEKIDQVLDGQKETIEKLDTVISRLDAIAQKLDKQETVNIFNNCNSLYYNRLKSQNTSYYNDAYDLYIKNKNDLSKVSADLGEYAKLWADGGYVNLTWDYIEYLATVRHSKYGKGMAKIYDGVTFDKYPWEHLGIGDRQCYRANDMFMISKCLFMINLYATYGGLSDIQKQGICNNVEACKPRLKEFCNFIAADPNEYRVCQIPGAHFVMHKELQKYNYCGKDDKAPTATGPEAVDAIYKPEWHEVGTITIDNPDALRSMLIRYNEADAIRKYYAPNKDKGWTDMLVNGDNAAGAKYAKDPTGTPILILYDTEANKVNNGIFYGGNGRAAIRPAMQGYDILQVEMGVYNTWGPKWYIIGYFHDQEYYMAIVQERY